MDARVKPAHDERELFRGGVNDMPNALYFSGFAPLAGFCV
jgi:hypothetical protein